MSSKWISVVGAREHNLKNVSVRLPRNKITVVTGLSGSGKSTLAFDTLYAEGQRRYVESLSAYARQFLDQLSKPQVDHIDGLSPAISIEQRVAGGNPRSTVATTTEIYDYVRLLYAHVGVPHCPNCGERIVSQSAEEIVDQLLERPARSRLVLLAPIVVGKKGEHRELLESLRKQGFVRVRLDGTIYAEDELPKLAKTKAHTIEAVIDRLVIADDVRGRLTDSVELALRVGGGTVISLDADAGDERVHSEKNACNDCGISFDVLQPRNFSFNSPYGACPACSGIGTKLSLCEDLLVPNPKLSLDKGAIDGWRRGGRRLMLYYKKQLRAIAKHLEIDLDTPFEDLPESARRVILHGSGDEDVTLRMSHRGVTRTVTKPFEGVMPNLERRYNETEADYVRQTLRKYMRREPCPDCHGRRLRPEIQAVTVRDVGVVDLVRMSVKDAAAFFAGLRLTKAEKAVVGDVVREIAARLGFMADVGLDYLTLDRRSDTLSGGEAQRIRLASQIGGGLVGVMYVLDEPTIGLHQRDNQRLVQTLSGLRTLGNTVVVVEHDEDTIRAADHVIDLGPAAGRHGGEVVFSGSFPELLACETSLTADFLADRRRIPVPAERRPSTSDRLRIVGAAENNLRRITVDIPLGLFVCVTGVSGSGKSTLVDTILKRALFRHFYNSAEAPGAHERIEGMDKVDKVVVIDQSPIGRTPRSNPATYTGAFGDIRNLFAELPGSKVRGYKPGRYSFNVKGGRCETCKGDGLIRIEMHFLPDVYVECEKCQGQRYNRETLEVRYNGRNIAEVLDMTIDDALEFFRNFPAIARKLRTLSEVGLGYLQLGQSSTTLSGGEAQRVKLSAELSRSPKGHTLYLLDEPTTGLHFADVERLLQVLLRLRDAGSTVLVIEHNLDVVKTADHIVDLGPEGGDNGGRVVVAGAPEDVARHPESHTGRYLKPKLAGR